MLKTEEIIAQLREIAKDRESFLVSDEPDSVYQKDVNALRVAIAELTEGEAFKREVIARKKEALELADKLKCYEDKNSCLEKELETLRKELSSREDEKEQLAEFWQGKVKALEDKTENLKGQIEAYQYCLNCFDFKR